MSKRGRSPRLELRLNSSPPRPPSSSRSPDEHSSLPSWMTSEGSSSSSSSSTCVSSSEVVETRAMLLVGCPRCLMYVMSSDMNPKCPNCKCDTTDILPDFLNQQNPNPTNNTSKH